MTGWFSLKEYFHLCQPRLIVRAAWLRIHQLLALNVGQLSSGSFRSCPSSLWMSLVLVSLVWFSFFLSEMRISSFGIWMNPILVNLYLYQTMCSLHIVNNHDQRNWAKFSTFLSYFLTKFLEICASWECLCVEILYELWVVSVKGKFVLGGFARVW